MCLLPCSNLIMSTFHSVHVCMCMCIHVCVCMCLRVPVYVCVRVCVDACVCVYACVCVCLCVCACVRSDPLPGSLSLWVSLPIIPLQTHTAQWGMLKGRSQQEVTLSWRVWRQRPSVPRQSACCMPLWSDPLTHSLSHTRTFWKGENVLTKYCFFVKCVGEF